MDVTYKAHSYLIERIENETDEGLSERAWFIIKQDPKTCNEFAQAVLWSKYWFYIKKFDCRYSEGVMKKVEELEAKMYC
jgi:hypothetical protein